MFLFPFEHCKLQIGCLLLTIVHVIRRWNFIESHKRVNIITSLLVIAGVTGYQMLVPDSLLSSIGTTMLLVGAYVNQENPAMQELSRYHNKKIMGFATQIKAGNTLHPVWS